MRKSRFTVVDGEVHAAVKKEPLAIFDLLEGLSLDDPKWAQMALLYVRKSKETIDISFFEEPKEFFLWYSKVLIVNGDKVFANAFIREDDGTWSPFSPPTLIGVNLKTKLR